MTAMLDAGAVLLAVMSPFFAVDDAIPDVVASPRRQQLEGANETHFAARVSISPISTGNLRHDLAMTGARFLIVGVALVSVAAIGVAYLRGSVSPERPHFESSPLVLPPYESSVGVPISLSLTRLQEILEATAPPDVSGTERPNVPGNVHNETLRWRAARGPISVAAENGRLVIRTALTGKATLYAEACPLGRALGCRSFTESANLAASVSAAISDIRISPDWKLSAQLTPTINVTEAESRVFGFVKVSFRSKLEAGLHGSIPKVQTAFEGFLSKLPIREEVERAWAAADHIFPVYENPPAWVVLAPTMLAIAPVEVSGDGLSSAIGIVFQAHTVLGDRPTDPKQALPPLANSQEVPSGFRLRVPILVPLDEITTQANASMPFTIQTGGPTIEVTNVNLEEGAGRILLAAEFTTGWLGAHGTAYVTGRPILVEDGTVLTVRDLGFDLRTRERLFDVTGEVLEPAILDALPNALRVDVRAQSELAKMELERRLLTLKLGDGIEQIVNIEDVQVDDVLVGDGKLALVVTADGSMSVRAP